jgi:hypothetical protein
MSRYCCAQKECSIKIAAIYWITAYVVIVIARAIFNRIDFKKSTKPRGVLTSSHLHHRRQSGQMLAPAQVSTDPPKVHGPTAVVWQIALHRLPERVVAGSRALLGAGLSAILCNGRDLRVRS